MKVEQLKTILNQSIKESLGETVIVNENLENVVDVGKAFLDNQADMDKYVKSLINHIGKVTFVDRPYKGHAPSVLMDGWEYGSVLEKISIGIPDADINNTWGVTGGEGLVDGHDYSTEIYKAPPKVEVKLYNQKDTYSINCSFGRKQVIQSFSNAGQLNSFFSMIESRISMRREIDMENLIRKVICNMMASPFSNIREPGLNVHNDNVSSKIKDSTVGCKCIDLSAMYKEKTGKVITRANCLYDADFIRFAVMQIDLYTNRMSTASKLFNAGGQIRFTPDNLLHLILLSDFAKAADVYLQSGTFHNEFTKLPSAEIIDFWQGSGTNYSFDDVSSVKLKSSIMGPAKTAVTLAGEGFKLSGIVGVAFDRDALGVTNMDNRVYSKFNESGEFYNNWYKYDAGYFNDLNENFIMFIVTDQKAG